NVRRSRMEHATRHDQMLLIRLARPCHRRREATNSANFAPKLPLITQVTRIKARRWSNARLPQQLLRSADARAFGSGFRRGVANAQVDRHKTVKPDELARCVLRLAMEGERDPVRLHDGALKGLLPATALA